jgi:hypothetical protein
MGNSNKGGFLGTILVTLVMSTPAATSNSSTRVRVKIPHLAAAGRGMITRSDASWQDAQRIL